MFWRGSMWRMALSASIGNSFRNQIIMTNEEKIITTERKKAHYNAFGPYRLGKTIGQGEFGKVKLGVHIKTGQQVHKINKTAIKLINKQ